MPSRLPFIDWMKCLGMGVIVLGHVASPWVNLLTPPFNPKQLGVAFFLFVTGYSLARERRPWSEVLVRRLFQVYLYGIAFALIMSATTWVRISDLAESNYLPFLLGINVAMDAFPANPTTWYIGTYIHVLLLWALALRSLRARPWMLVAVALAEVAIRAVLMRWIGLFTSYMLATSWMTVFLLGLFQGQRALELPSRAAGMVAPLCLVGVLAIGWPWVARLYLAPQLSFPFQRFLTGSVVVDFGLTSAAVTFLYTSYTWSIFRITRQLPDWAPVRFLARNTLFIFIAHMPVYYGLWPWLSSRIDPDAARVLLFFMCFFGLALVSEAVQGLIRPSAIRNRVLAWGWGRAERHAQVS